MFSIRSLNEVGASSSDSYEHMFDQNLSSQTNGADRNQMMMMMSTKSTAEAKALAASISHKEAERRRRKRINGHIATLKSILPNNIKADKASLLGEAVRRVRELKKMTAQLVSSPEEGENPAPTTAPLKLMFPSEKDELKLTRCESSGLVRASLSCEDRPGMIFDMIEALKSAEAKAVRAEMSTVGGRSKSVLWVEMAGTPAEAGESDVAVGTLRRALKEVMDKSILSAGSSQALAGNKRPRYCHL